LEDIVDSKKHFKEVSDKALLAGLKHEMAKPCTCESARIEDEKQSHAKSHKPAR
jgi:hypothetical protein